MKVANHYGTCASFFTYWEDKNWKASEWNEIDIEIVPSVALNNQSPFSTNLIYGDHTKKNNDQQYVPFTTDWSSYHEYEIQWTPEHVIWKFDHVEVRKVL